MTVTPLNIGEDAPSLRLDGSLRAHLPRNSPSPTKSVFDTSATFSLRLSKVIGTTTTSASGFDFNTENSVFVTCAGSIAVWNQVEPDLTITQRFLRAHPSVSPLPTTSNEPSTPTKTEHRKSRLSPVRASIIGIQNTPSSPSQSNPGTPGKSGARQGSRAAVCVSLSSDGTTLAVGEVGYNPQIYIFSCASENPYPIAALSEHTYGVRCLALSADARWLASVGDIHDGYIFLWSLGGRGQGVKLQGSNKCTSAVNAMAWMGNTIVTVGLRHVKVWRPQAAVPSSPNKSKFKPDLTDAISSSPGSRTLHGRNSILGELLESDFTCVRALSSTRAIVGTDRGELCVLDDLAGNQKLLPVLKVGFPIHCISIDTSMRTIWIGGSKSRVHRLRFEELDRLLASPVMTPCSLSSASRDGPNDTNSLIGLAPLRNCLVGLDSNRTLRVMEKCDAVDFELKVLREYTSHQGSVLPPTVVRSTGTMGDGFMTYDSTGVLKMWNSQGILQCGRNLPLDQLPSDEDIERNEIKLVRVCSSGKKVIAGDKYGILRMVDLESWEDVFSIRAHHGEVNDIAFNQQLGVTELAASAARDRSIQIFEIFEKELSLLQTIDQHTSSVNCISFAQDGKTLFSASADRTIAVYVLASNDGSRAFLPMRVMTMKQSPISMVLDPKELNTVHVSTTDKQVHTFDTNSGQCTSSNKTAGERQNNPVLLSSMTLHPFDTGAVAKRLFIGASSTDKSVRIHDADSGLAVTHEHGHSEGVSGVAVMALPRSDAEKTLQVISAGLDGTVMLWDLTFAPRSLDQASNSSPVHEMPTLASPLRRVLPKAAFADFSRSLEAEGMTPIPQPTSSRGSSPTRRRMSVIPAATTPKPQTPRARRRDRSPSPSTPSTPTQAPKNPIMKAVLPEPASSLNLATEALGRALRNFRSSLTNSSQGLDPEQSGELEQELKATLKSMGKSVDVTPADDAESRADQILERYAERLVQLVETKVSFGLASRTSTADTAETSEVSSSVDGSECASESEESEPPRKLEAVFE